MIKTDKYHIKFSDKVSYEDAEAFRKLWAKVGAEIEEMDFNFGADSNDALNTTRCTDEPLSELIARYDYINNWYETSDSRKWGEIAKAIEAQIQKRLEEEYLIDERV